MQNDREIKKSPVAKKEEAILSFWQERDIFKKSLEKEAPKGNFVFYDGPPFATGLPHYGHLLAGTIKDLIPRYKTMRGYHVPRRWGWDCHGLPIENLIEKELGLASKKDIENYGIEKFNTAARNAILRYEKEWKKIIPRSGRFVDMDQPYMAMDPDYMESIWWVFGELHKKGLTKEGFKAMHLCPRCETTLANFEVNQGYKDITDISLTAKFELADEEGTFLLAWTTTPWTLPGNVALAVGPDIDYVKVNADGEKYILAKNLLEKVFEKRDFEILDSFKGKDLVGKAYIPLFDYYQKDDTIEHRENGWKIYPADFVSTEEGTGIVHIAPAFGADDMQLGEMHDLPFIQHISQSGAFKHVFAKTIDGESFAGKLVKKKGDSMSADIEIIKRLAHDGKLFAKYKVVHSYPHCWRCDTPLLNYATSSWYIDVPKIKDKLIASNKKVHWVPEHIGTGRFGKWLEGAREWALSRSRFWGTPIPVWKHPENGENLIISSYADLLQYAKKSGNRYFGFRHGEANSNLEGRISAYETEKDGLTEKGKTQVLKGLERLPVKPDIIISSPLRRTRETTEILKEAFELDDDEIIFDERIGEYLPGEVWEGKSWEDFHRERKQNAQLMFRERPFEGAESIADVYQRMMRVLFELEEKFQGKNILIVSHGMPLHMLQFGEKYQGREKYLSNFYKPSSIKNADPFEIHFTPFPHNEEMILDIHRPYIDDFVIEKDGVKYERIKDVFDVWFDSSSMPYAQQHYPFENKEDFLEKHFPAQFIAEGLDQTRGWFYVLTVIGNALFGKTPFENVVVNGLILAEDGKKMSKSLKNYPDPQLIFDTSGADAMRLYMLNSPVVRAEEFAFSEKGVKEVASKVLGRLRNSLTLYTLYRDDLPHERKAHTQNILDRWILARLEYLREELSASLDAYFIDKATRELFAFVDDLSTWYMRRSRDRLKGEDLEDKREALETMAYLFHYLSRIFAPFAPFIAEEIWQTLREKDESLEESVHLASWPEEEEDFKNISLLEKMQKLREIISVGLQMRADAGIKVRQPLASFQFPLGEFGEDFYPLVKDELNVKNLFDGDFALDTEITEALKKEGVFRELLRFIQKMRKEAGLQAGDKVFLQIATDAKGREILDLYGEEMKKTASLEKIVFEDFDDGIEKEIEDYHFRLKLK